MSTKTNFYLNDKKINPPKNWKELQIELNFDKDNPNSQVSVNDWNFVRENADTVNGFIDGGLTGGNGIFEGVHFRIEVERNSVVEKPFDGYIDLTDDASLSPDSATSKAKERQKIDWLNDIADSFTFEYLFRETGEITKEDFIFQPYVINSVPDYKEAAICTISVFLIQEQLKIAIENLSELLIEAGNPFEASALIRCFLYVLYLTSLLASIVILIQQLVKLIIQPVKYHAGMYWKTQLERGAAHLGLTFKSSIFDADPYERAVIIPEKYYNAKNDDSQLFGFLTPNRNEQEGFYKGTFGDLLRATKAAFNAKIIINSDKELILERVDYNPSNAQYQLPPIYQPFHKTNASEFKSNYYIKFQTDISDKNTIQEYAGTGYQVITQPVSYTNKDLVLMKGLVQVEIPFALAKVKTELTVPEEIVKVFLDIFGTLVNAMVVGVNAIISVYNSIARTLNKILRALRTIGITVRFELKTITPLKKVNPGASIENRIGMMKLETDIITVAKVYILSAGSESKKNKIDTNNASYLSAEYLYQNFHYTNSFVPTDDRPNANQVLIKEFNKVPFTFNDYLLVKNNNRILTSSGQSAEVSTLKWNIYNEQANMVVRISSLYTNNLQEKILNPDGK